MARNSKKKTVVKRETVMGPIIATMNIGHNAEELPFDDGGDIKKYRICNMSVPGGVFQVFAFGVVEPGKNVPVTFEVKTKSVNGGEPVHYGRAEVMTGTEKPKHKIYIGTPDDKNIKADPSLPDMFIEEHGRRVRICFILKGGK